MSIDLSQRHRSLLVHPIIITNDMLNGELIRLDGEIRLGLK